MGEIKSTLELVMERTKHLSLSKAEKDEQHIIMFRKKINGALQKYLDKIIEKKEFKKQMDALKKEHDVEDNKIIIKEILDRIMLDKNNTDLFFLLQDELKANTNNIEKVIDNYKTEDTNIH